MVICYVQLGIAHSEVLLNVWLLRMMKRSAAQ